MNQTPPDPFEDEPKPFTRMDGFAFACVCAVSALMWAGIAYMCWNVIKGAP